MAESLVTLLETPVPSTALASGDLARSVSALGRHESARIRSLTRDVVRRWRSAVQSQLDSARAAMEALNNLSPLTPPPEKEGLAFVGNTRVPVVATGKDETRIKDTPAKFPSKRTRVATGRSRNETAAKLPSKRAPVDGRSCSGSDEVLATKRKLYQEAENAKCEGKIRVVEDTKVLEEPRQKKMHPIAITQRESSRATVRRSLMPSYVA